MRLCCCIALVFMFMPLFKDRQVFRDYAALLCRRLRQTMVSRVPVRIVRRFQISGFFMPLVQQIRYLIRSNVLIRHQNQQMVRQIGDFFYCVAVLLFRRNYNSATPPPPFSKSCQAPVKQIPWYELGMLVPAVEDCIVDVLNAVHNTVSFLQISVEF